MCVWRGHLHSLAHRDRGRSTRQDSASGKQSNGPVSEAVRGSFGEWSARQRVREREREVILLQIDLGALLIPLVLSESSLL